MAKTSRYRLIKGKPQGIHFLIDAKVGEAFSLVCHKRGFSKAFFLRSKIDELVRTEMKSAPVIEARSRVAQTGKKGKGGKGSNRPLLTKAARAIKSKRS